MIPSANPTASGTRLVPNHASTLCSSFAANLAISIFGSFIYFTPLSFSVTCSPPKPSMPTVSAES